MGVTEEQLHLLIEQIDTIILELQEESRNNPAIAPFHKESIHRFQGRKEAYELLLQLY